MDVRIATKTQKNGYRFVTDDYEFVQLIIVHEGSLRLKVRNEVTPIKPGMLLLLRYGGQFELFCRNESYNGIGILTSDRVCSMDHGAALPLVSGPDMRNMAALIREELERPRKDSNAVLLPLGEALLQLSFRRAREQGRGDARDANSEYWAELVRDAIERNVYGNLNLNQVFDGADLGYRQLARHFIAEYGMSPKKYQLLCRLDEAKRLLSGTRLSITSIAMELGFPTSQHFAAQFRRHAGATPTSYREKEGVQNSA